MTTMPTSALQALYERFNTYKDRNLRKQFFAQLKKEAPAFKKQLIEQMRQEQPGFKLQSNIKEFLQHIAYGEQDEAEALLQKDPAFAQELLKGHNIPFTDYSGRTFTCTAYEYAYWAKDAHMLKMLEKYIKQDEETRQFILGRVNAIEGPINPPATSAYFQPPPKPQGLHYTTQDKHGKTTQTTNHWQAHFDLTPLKTALQTYIDAYNRSPKLAESDWKALDMIWIKVGLPQREVPAHIAQEYCHWYRSFYDVSQNKFLLSVAKPDGTPIPGNLIRQLKFFNYVTGDCDSWFTRGTNSSDSGLGVSFAILRGNRWDKCEGKGGLGFRPGSRERGRLRASVIDLAALEAH